jgi:hypothetical protein
MLEIFDLVEGVNTMEFGKKKQSEHNIGQKNRRQRIRTA